ncbi:LOW QUALITY PROTEIN: hypothetical protein CFC21_009375 [Triticum aestivum]|uniref:F-box domain-containing protein n=2 Tax=Triticum aestivum TaxID=4565 RepID=A0A9R1DIB3_WHEAT|nr:LOW QUALITY PROTEIN: hypothetical protein CFC21_009375 [Triticum aestivum]
MDMEHTDLLLDILRRLPPCSLAVSRCVCTAWRGTVDHHHLLRADLLPLSLDAVIYNELQMDPPKLFGRRLTTRYITSNLDYVADDPDYTDFVLDYCNGLFLVESVKVVNPATRQWARLPLVKCGPCHSNRYLAYDPTVSPHYEVFFIPRIRAASAETICSALEGEVMHVYSSKTHVWKEKSFVREGDAAGTIQDVQSCYNSDRSMYYTAYWQGSLYVPSRHIKNAFLLRINLSTDKYQVIKLPKAGVGDFRLGRSKKGVYCVLHTNVPCTFQVWFLHESCGSIDWVFKNEINLEPAFSKEWHAGPWIPQPPEKIELLLQNDVNLKLVDEYNQALRKDDFEWDSEDENVVSITDWPKKCDDDIRVLYCLGFHPYKEIVLFHQTRLCPCSVVAYHLSSSKVRYLGQLLPRCRYSTEEISFAYTPCWMMDLPGRN